MQFRVVSHGVTDYKTSGYQFIQASLLAHGASIRDGGTPIPLNERV